MRAQRPVVSDFQTMSDLDSSINPPPHLSSFPSLCIPHAAAAFREQHANLFQPLSLELIPFATTTTGPYPAMAQGVRTWVFKFRVLLERNLWIYIRNPGNVLARFLVYTSLGIAAGILCWDIGRGDGPHTATDFMGMAFERWDA